MKEGVMLLRREELKEAIYPALNPHLARQVVYEEGATLGTEKGKKRVGAKKCFAHLILTRQAVRREGAWTRAFAPLGGVGARPLSRLLKK